MVTTKTAMSILVISSALVALTASASANATPASVQVDKLPQPKPAALDPKPTPAETTASALVSWIDQSKDLNKADPVITDDFKSVIAYWKGEAPSELRELATTQPASVEFREAQYSSDELIAAGRTLVEQNKGVVTAAGPAADYSGLSIDLSSTAEAARKKVRSASGIPIVATHINDPVPLNRVEGNHPALGGSLIRARGVKGSMCGSGASMYAGTISFISTASHCGPGTWTSYKNDNELGVVKISRPNLDFEIIEADSMALIWNGGPLEEDSEWAMGMQRPVVNQRVVCSCSNSGQSTQEIIVHQTGSTWQIPDTGQTVSPGFLAYSRAGFGIGSVQQGDSGSPIIRSNTAGDYLVQGFLSAAWGLGADSCEPKAYTQGDCWTGFYAVYADAAISSIAGLHLKVRPW